jgi:hypothetical protein
MVINFKLDNEAIKKQVEYYLTLDSKLVHDELFRQELDLKAGEHYQFFK